MPPQTNVTTPVSDPASVSVPSGRGPQVGTRTRHVLLVAAAAAALRVAFLTVPLSPDEGGYLHAAARWAPGSSTYGDLFVDRPPLLMTIFALADAAGGLMTLRLIGLAAVVVTVVLAGRLGGAHAAVTAALLLSMPLLEPFPVNGELLTLPFILAGALYLWAGRGPRAWALAGALGACAVLVKQNALDVGVLAAALLVLDVRREGIHAPLARAGAFLGAAFATCLTAVAAAALRGTSPTKLFDAVVAFRAQAAEVIHAFHDPTGHEREITLLLIAGVSVVPFVLAALASPARSDTSDPRGYSPGHSRGHRDLKGVAVVLLAVESLCLVGGSGFWQHYLIALVPGTVLLVASVRPTRLVVAAAALAAVSLGVQFVLAEHDPSGADQDRAVSTWLRENAAPGDTVVVAFGHPNIIEQAGLDTPYENLWVLPVRVRDPRLTRLDAVLTSPDAPNWVVVHGRSTATRGVEHRHTEKVLRARYVQVAREGEWRILRRTSRAGAATIRPPE